MLESLRDQGVNNSIRVHMTSVNRLCYVSFLVEKIHLLDSFEPVAWFSTPFWK